MTSSSNIRSRSASSRAALGACLLLAAHLDGEDLAPALSFPLSGFHCYTAPVDFQDIRPTPEGRRVYAASRGGLLEFDRSGACTGTYTRGDGLCSHILHEVLPLDDGSLWIATAAGVSLRQPDGSWRTFTTREGLNDDCAYAVARGADGDVYVGTRQGVSRLVDGRFRPFYDTHEFGRRATYRIHPAADGTIWFAKENALTRYLGNGKWQTFQDDPMQAGRRGRIPSNNVLCVETDASHRPWIGTKMGLGYFDGDGWTRYVYAERFFNGKGLLDNRVETLALDRAGYVWLAHGDSRDFAQPLGVTRFRGDKWEYFTAQNGLPSDRVHRIRVDSSNTVWMATANGGCSLTGKRFTYYTCDSDIPGNHVTEIAAAADGLVAVLTARGLSFFLGGRAHPVEAPPADDIAGICASGGVLYAGTGTGSLLYRTNGVWRVDASWAAAPVWSLRASPDGTVWLCSARGVFAGRPGAWRRFSGVEPEAVWTGTRVFPGPADRVWLTGLRSDRGVMEFQGSQCRRLSGDVESGQPALDYVTYGPEGTAWLCASGGLYVPEKQRKVDLRGIRFLAPRVAVWDPAGDFWVGTRDEGLLYRRRGQWRRVLLNGLAFPREITCLCPESADILWVGTASEGAIRLDVRELRSAGTGIDRAGSDEPGRR